MKPSVVFMGTPDFAVPSLRMLAENGYPVLACVTQPDRPAGRGHRLVEPPVKAFARQAGILVCQFEKVSAPDGAALLRKLAPDVMVTAAFGHILSEEILAIPRYGCINVHASLLPGLRGPAPIQWAIINGEKKTGVTTMYTVKALDAGDILERDETEIPPDMTAGELYDVLKELGAKTLLRTLRKLEAGTLTRTPQDEGKATYFPMFRKGFGEIDYRCPGQAVVNLVRGTNPAPGAFMVYKGEKIKVLKVSRAGEKTDDPCGTVVEADGRAGLRIVCGDCVLSVDRLQRQGARPMTAAESLRGKPIDVGYCFRREP